jgi:general secretion pathway protein K
VESGQVAPVALARFRRLFDLLGLPASQLTTMAENLRFAMDKSADNRSAAMAPLLPQQVEQLVWLGLSPQTVEVLKPYVTLIPTSAKPPVNLNTASAEVIYASVAGISMADAQRLVTVRDRSYFRTVGEASRLVPSLDPTAFGSAVSVNSSWFESRGRLRLGTTVIEERSVLQRTNPIVRALQRERGVIAAPPPGGSLPGR